MTERSEVPNVAPLETVRDSDIQRDDATVALDAVRKIVRSLRTLGAATEGEYRVSAAQLFVLREIAAQPGQSLAELARRTLTSQGSVSEVVARLVLRGFVVRRMDPNDRRRAAFRLSPSGERVVTLAPESVQERLVAGFLSLPADERQALARSLEAWVAASGLDDVPATMFLEPLAPA